MLGRRDLRIGVVLLQGVHVGLRDIFRRIEGWCRAHRAAVAFDAISGAVGIVPSLDAKQDVGMRCGPKCGRLLIPRQEVMCIHCSALRSTAEVDLLFGWQA
jgi:hypothetical protein